MKFIPTGWNMNDVEDALRRVDVRLTVRRVDL